MRYFKFGKLVRDKILPYMQQNNQIPRGVKKLNDDEFITELIRKILEEASEMSSVSNKENLKNELADVYEILDHLKETLKLSDTELDNRKKQKKEKNGGFKDRIYIEDVGIEEDNQWFKYYIDNPKKYPEVK